MLDWSVMLASTCSVRCAALPPRHGAMPEAGESLGAEGSSTPPPLSPHSRLAAFAFLRKPQGSSLSTRDGALLKGMEGGRPQVVRRLARDVAEILLGLDGCTHRDEAVHKLPFSFCLPGRARSHLAELLDKEERRGLVVEVDHGTISATQGSQGPGGAHRRTGRGPVPRHKLA